MLGRCIHIDKLHGTRRNWDDSLVFYDMVYRSLSMHAPNYGQFQMGLHSPCDCGLHELFWRMCAWPDQFGPQHLVMKKYNQILSSNILDIKLSFFLTRQWNSLVATGCCCNWTSCRHILCLFFCSFYTSWTDSLLNWKVLGHFFSFCIDYTHYDMY